MPKIQAVLPIALRDINRSKILFQSLNTFFDPDSLDLILIIVPELEPIESMLSSFPVKFTTKLLTEKELIPEGDWKGFLKKKGWVKQQILKIQAAKYTKTNFYLCLDADIICIRDTDYSKLIKNNKPIANIELKSYHKKWWNKSQKVLKTPKSNSKNGIGVTPSILITSEVLGLIKHLEMKYKQSFVKTLCQKKDWTEYTLYWLYIELCNNESLYVHDDTLYGESIWQSSIKTKTLFDTVFNKSNKGYFIVCQSTTVTDEQAYEMSKCFLGEWDMQ